MANSEGQRSAKQTPPNTSFAIRYSTFDIPLWVKLPERIKVVNGLALLQPRAHQRAAGAIDADSREDEAFRRIAAALGKITGRAVGASGDSAGGEMDKFAGIRRSHLPTYLEEVSQTVDRLAAEHAGMAEELLCVYEQLGVVFEVTRRLHTVRQESEVVDLFIESLSRTFHKHDVFYVPAERVARKTQDGGDGDTSDSHLNGKGAPRSRRDPASPALGPPRRKRPQRSRGLKTLGSLAGFVPSVMTMVERARGTGTVLVERLPLAGGTRPTSNAGGVFHAPRAEVEGGQSDLRGDSACDVACSPRGVEGDGSATVEVMVAPVFAGWAGPDKVEHSSEPDSFVGAIVLSHASAVRGETAGATESFRASDMLLLESLATFCGDLIRNHRLVGQLRDMAIVLVRSLVGAVEQKDPYTSGHSLRVGYFATMLGKALGLDQAELLTLQWAALLHDVGKIGIRDDVLKKEGRLTEEEFRHIKEHPVRSHQVVSSLGGELAGALDGVLYHHERYDGRGYPRGLAGESIPLQARIIQIADIFDALTSTRSYRPAFSWSRALTILQEESGKAVDPRLQAVFDTCIRAQVADDDGWNKLLRRANAFTQSALLAGADPLAPAGFLQGRGQG